MQQPALGTGRSSQLVLTLSSRFQAHQPVGKWTPLLLGLGLVCPAIVVSHSTIAVLPRELILLIWLHGLVKMKYGLVATALQHPGLSQLFKMMKKLSKLHVRVIITGNMVGPLPTP